MTITLDEIDAFAAWHFENTPGKAGDEIKRICDAARKGVMSQRCDAARKGVMSQRIAPTIDDNEAGVGPQVQTITVAPDWDGTHSPLHAQAIDEVWERENGYEEEAREITDGERNFVNALRNPWGMNDGIERGQSTDWEHDLRHKAADLIEHLFATNRRIGKRQQQSCKEDAHLVEVLEKIANDASKIARMAAVSIVRAALGKK